MKTLKKKKKHYPRGNKVKKKKEKIKKWTESQWDMGQFQSA